MSLEVPLSSVKGLIKVNEENICENGESILSLGLVEGQGIQAKVLRVIADKNTLVLSCKKTHLWNGELEVLLVSVLNPLM